MTVRSLRAHWPLAVAVSLLALLCVLGWLQYRWVGQVSAAERERMESRVRAGVAQFASEFDREIARAFIMLQVRPLALRESDASEYKAQYDLWYATTQYPRLVKEIHVAVKDEQGGVELRRFDPETGALEPTAWPAELESVRASVTSGDRVIDVADGIRRPVVNPVRPEIPALVSSSPQFRVLIEDGRERFDLEGKALYTILTLDREYIADALMPDLTARYFPSDASGTFRVGVLEASGAAPVFVSESGLTAREFEVADATASILGIGVDEMEDVEIHRQAVMPATARIVRELPPDRVLVRPRHGGVAHTSAPSEIGVRKAAPKTHAKAFVFQRDIARTSDVSASRDAGAWRLAVRHSEGSLDAAVAGARAKNLAIGLGILALLGASVLLLVASTRRAQALARQQMEFVAGVSHELRTPLAVIRSAGENLAHGVVASPPQVRQYGTLIEGEGRRLSGMVEQVLQFAGSQSGKRRYEARPTDAGAAVEEALSTFRHELEAGAFEVEVDVESGLPDVMADPVALRQAIENLLGNAIKYGGDARWVRLEARRDGPEVVVTVEDRGRGIPRDEVGKVFDPFFRGRDVISDQIHGSGLGLSLVRHAADAQGWRLGVESEPGRGSAFMLRLPVTSAASVEPV